MIVDKEKYPIVYKFRIGQLERRIKKLKDELKQLEDQLKEMKN